MRCKSCDVILTSSEIVWKPEHNCHEDLCNRCLKIIDKSEEPLTTVIQEEIDASSLDGIEFGDSEHESM